MSATPDSSLADSERLIADLQPQLPKCRAERDEALEQQTATAEVLQVINSRPATLSRTMTPIRARDQQERAAGAVAGLRTTSLRDPKPEPPLFEDADPAEACAIRLGDSFMVAGGGQWRFRIAPRGRDPRSGRRPKSGL